MEDTLIMNKIDFVSNLNGTTIYEVIMISTISASSMLFRAAILFAMPESLLKISATKFFVDFFTIFMPLVLSVTVWSAYLEQLFFTIAILSVSWIYLMSKLITVPKEKVVHSCYVAPPFYENIVSQFATDKDESVSRVQAIDSNISGNIKDCDDIFLLPSNLPFLTTFRAFVSIATCICILAVDFNLFPRRFAKCETYGVSVMGLGVGGFVVINALVSPEARSSRRTDKTKTLNSGFLSVCMQFFSTWPLIVMGLIRLASVKMSGYQVHVSEYGIHWNFFFTLALVRILSTFLLAIISVQFCGVVAAFLAVAYQVLLSENSYDLTTFLMSNDHEGSFLVQNKEGIASSFGLLSLYLAAVELGLFVFKPRHTFSEWKQAAVKMFVLSIVLYFALKFSILFVQPVSRRIGNLPYVLWMLYYTTLFLFQYLFVDLVVVYLIDSKLLPPKCMPNRWYMLSRKNAVKGLKIIHTPEAPKPCLLSAINRNQLLYFLLCNLFTGGINMTINTPAVKTELGLIIVTVYCFIGALFVWTLHRKSITFKFW